MSKSKIKILCTKQLDEFQSQRIEAIADLIHFDLLQTNELKVDLSDYSKDVIFTSFKGTQYGLKLLGESAKKSRFYCVGNKSVQLLQSLNLEVAFTSDYSLELGKWILENAAENSYSYLCNKSRLNDLPDFLNINSVHFNEIHTYESKVVDLSKDSENYQAYLWFSPMGVKSFEDKKEELQEAQHICIGKTTASALESIVENKFNIWYPSSPSVELMVDQVLHLYS